MPFDRSIFFDSVRPMFGGKLAQEQVDGMGFILQCWEDVHEGQDLRHCAYPLATTKWETASTMQPIEEYGKGAGMDYGKPDPQTGQTYYGRGFVQLTWKTNYARADKELELTGRESCEWYAENALNPDIAAAVMFVGMFEGWFRSDSKGPHTLYRYFNDAGTDDPVNAREIINGDKNYTKDWLPKGMTVGQAIANDHWTFLEALKASYRPTVSPYAEDTVTVDIIVRAPPGVRVVFNIKDPEV